MASGEVGRPSPQQFTLVSASFFVSSGLGLLLLVLAARWLSPTENAQFLAVWGLVFAFGSVLAAVEQEIARQAATAALQGQRVPLGVIQMVGVSALGGVGVLAALLATPPGRTLVDGSATVAALVLVSLLGFAGQTLTRGVILGRHEITPYAAVILAESVVRLLALCVLVLVGVQGSVPLAVFVAVLGCFGWVAVATRLLPALDWRGPPSNWRHVGATTAALGAANGLSALILTGFPAVATVVIGRPDRLATLFAVVVLARTPLVLLAPLQAMMVPAVVGWCRRGETDRLARVLRLITLGAAAATLLGASAGFVAGPAVIEFVLGTEYRPTGALVALVMGATCVMAAALLQAAVLVALERRWQLTACWALAIVAGSLLMALLPGGPEQRGSWGLVGASFAAFMATAVVVRQAPVSTGGDSERRQH